MKEVVLKRVDVVRARLKVCASCDQLRRGLLHTCKACGCPIKTKVVGTNSCPLKKWEA